MQVPAIPPGAQPRRGWATSGSQRGESHGRTTDDLLPKLVVKKGGRLKLARFHDAWLEDAERRLCLALCPRPGALDALGEEHLGTASLFLDLGLLGLGEALSWLRVGEGVCRSRFKA